MRANPRLPRWLFAGSGLGVLLVAGLLIVTVAPPSKAAFFLAGWWKGHLGSHPPCAHDGPPVDEVGGTWYWLHSPEEEKRVTMALYNRYCIRCHGVDGRGVWDIPGIPDFTNTVWQASRSDADIARIILEGRGAVMPSFRGTLSLEEAYAMARYLRTLVPGTENPRPDFKGGAKK